MNPKITPDHLARGAVVYVRQSTMTQVVEHTESQRRQYALVEAARAAGFASVQTIDDDLGRSGSGLMDRPGFQKLVALVCAGSVGAVYCIEASRLARNGRDWHHLIDLCALVGAVVVDGDGAYDPRFVNDRLLLGLKGTMSEYELKRHVVRELEARWNAALERVSQLEQRLKKAEEDETNRPKIDRDALMHLAYDLPAAWNAPTTDARTRQRLTRIVIEEVVIDLDNASNEAVVTIHWVGGRHTEVRVARVKTGRYPADRKPNAVEVMRKLGGQWPDRDVAVTMNRMRCRASDGATWTTVRVRELRERLGIPVYDPAAQKEETISVDETAQRLKICVGSVHLLIRQGVLPATQLMPSAPWKVPVAALETEALKTGVRAIMARRPKNYPDLQALTTPRLPGF